LCGALIGDVRRRRTAALSVLVLGVISRGSDLQ
jgi:hypothetical protein